MTPARQKRLFLIVLMITGVAVGVTFIFKSLLNENTMFFIPPADIKAGKAPVDRLFRVGGMVVDDSIRRPGDGLTVLFELADNFEQVTVQYTGILPDLFREGQGIVANGRLNKEGRFVAEEVLAKHDETYMPPEVVEAMKRKNNNNESVY
ncbi:MAG: cytochrome c-type biogenesis protein CcmE [Gammaproteobacteria bacterium]|jgi:cytochrome c-type biogenesis protein CcmE